MPSPSSLSRSACSPWWPGAVGGRWELPSQGIEQPLSFLDHPGPTDVTRVSVARRPQGAPGRGVVDRTRSRLRADARGPAGRVAGAHPGWPGPGRPGGERGPPRYLRRHRAPGPAPGVGRRGLRRPGPGPGALDGGLAPPVGRRAAAARGRDPPPESGRPARRSGGGRGAGVRERRGDDGHRPARRAIARGATMELSERGRRGGLAAGAHVPGGIVARRRHRAVGCALRGVRPRRELRPEHRRPLGGPTARVRLGGPVHDQGTRRALAVAVPVCVAGRPGRDRGLGRPARRRSSDRRRIRSRPGHRSAS